MSGAPITSPVPLCEACWLKDHARWEPHSMDDKGNIKMALAGVDVPQKINTGSVETCSDCGKITIAGIYDFKSPEIVITSLDSNYGDNDYEYQEEDQDDF
jgi:hypothetical protein